MRLSQLVSIRSIFGLVMASFLLHPIDALCCDCVMNDFETEYSASDLIFKGKVVDQSTCTEGALMPNPFLYPDGCQEYTTKNRFKVDTIWKGDLADYIVITNQSSLQDCQFYGGFNLDDEFLVYAKKKDDIFVLTYCSRTSYIGWQDKKSMRSNGKEDIKKLDEKGVLSFGSWYPQPLKKLALDSEVIALITISDSEVVTHRNMPLEEVKEKVWVEYKVEVDEYLKHLWGEEGKKTKKILWSFSTFVKDILKPGKYLIFTTYDDHNSKPNDFWSGSVFSIDGKPYAPSLNRILPNSISKTGELNKELLRDSVQSAFPDNQKQRYRVFLDTSWGSEGLFFWKEKRFQTVKITWNKRSQQLISENTCKRPKELQNIAPVGFYLETSRFATEKLQSLADKKDSNVWEFEGEWRDGSFFVDDFKNLGPEACR